MKAVTATEARKSLGRLLEEIAVTGEPVLITSKRATAVLVSQEDWRAREATLYLLSIPQMAESIRDGMKTPIDECVEEQDW
jgi:antitoxin YefM